MKKTAEFEAQQARQRAVSEPNSSDDHDQGVTGEVYGLSRHRQQLGLSTAEFDEPDGSNDDSDEAESDRQQSVFEEPDVGGLGLGHSQHTTGSPASSDSDGFIHIKYDDDSSAAHATHMMSGATHSATGPDVFEVEQRQEEFHTPVPYTLGLDPSHLGNGIMPQTYDIISAQTGMDTFSERSFYDISSVPQFPSQLITEAIARNNNDSSAHNQPLEVYIKPENVSPCSVAASLPAPADLRFKSPPPPADIASRRNMRRPAPLGLSAIRGCAGPKTGIDAPRRSETASPMRRISSATGGLPGRIQKTFVNNGGPRSPFMMERTKEALYQSLQSSHPPAVAPLSNAMSPVSPADANSHGLCEKTATTNASDDEHGFAFGPVGAISGFPVYKSDSNMKTPPDTPALAANFPEHFFPSSVEQAWNFGPHDEPLPTPSLCSHGGSELEFSVAPQMPGYVASQPVTPSFPPSIGPTYGGFFGGGNMANAEYTFPDSYPPESEARSSPGGPLKSRQFQFAQNITPQDFNAEK